MAADEAVLDRAQAPVLDVGCGPGRHVLALARRGHLALGVDIAPGRRARRPAARRAGDRGLGLRSRPRRRDLGQRTAAGREHRHRRRARGAARTAARPAAPGRRGPRRARAARRRARRASRSSSSTPASTQARSRGRTSASTRSKRRPRAAGFIVAERWDDEQRWFARLVADGCGMKRPRGSRRLRRQASGGPSSARAVSRGRVLQPTARRARSPPGSAWRSGSRSSRASRPASSRTSPSTRSTSAFSPRRPRRAGCTGSPRASTSPRASPRSRCCC